MVLYHYFRTTNDASKQHDPHGSLSETMPSLSIALANSEVKALLQSEEHTVSGQLFTTTDILVSGKAILIFFLGGLSLHSDGVNVRVH